VIEAKAEDHAEDGGVCRIPELLKQGKRVVNQSTFN